MSENTLHNVNNISSTDEDILIDDCIQAPKVSNAIAKPTKRRNLKYEKVIEVVKSSSPDLNEKVKAPRKQPDKSEPVKSEPIPIPMENTFVIPVEPKIRKTRSDAGKKKDMSKAIAVRDKNRAIEKERKLKLQEEYDKEYEAKIIEKAVQLKKAQLKRNRQIESVKVEEKVEERQTALASEKKQEKPKKQIIFY
jgi:hypothetical protein